MLSGFINSFLSFCVYPEPERHRLPLRGCQVVASAVLLLQVSAGGCGRHIFHPDAGLQGPRFDLSDPRGFILPRAPSPGPPRLLTLSRRVSCSVFLSLPATPTAQTFTQSAHQGSSVLTSQPIWGEASFIFSRTHRLQEERARGPLYPEVGQIQASS